MPIQPLIARAAPVLLLAAALPGLLAPAGCAGPGASRVSGLPLLKTRTVRVGDVVEISIPAENLGPVPWGIERYDSLRLSLMGPIVVRRRPDGTIEHVYRFRAKVPGTTKVTLRDESATSRTETFEIRILDL